MAPTKRLGEDLGADLPAGGPGARRRPSSPRRSMRAMTIALATPTPPTSSATAPRPSRRPVHAGSSASSSDPTIKVEIALPSLGKAGGPGPGTRRDQSRDHPQRRADRPRNGADRSAPRAATPSKWSTAAGPGLRQCRWAEPPQTAWSQDHGGQALKSQVASDPRVARCPTANSRLSQQPAQGFDRGYAVVVRGVGTKQDGHVPTLLIPAADRDACNRGHASLAEL